MKRIRAKELLPIIQAYAEGKELQYKVVGYEDWHDVDDEDGINEGTRYEYRIKPSDKYNFMRSRNTGEIMTEELFRYLDMCVTFHHENDVSFKITDGAYEKENLMYLKAIHYLNELYKENKENSNEPNDYRPFQNCDELIDFYKRKNNIVNNEDVMPLIWVKHKIDGKRKMIVGFDDNFIEVGVKAKPVTFGQLFEMYTFLDNEPCGVMEK